MVKVSVIIPCYNQEEYIAECLNSVLASTYKDYEIIVVNDESTDNSLNIIQEYAKNHKCIKIINQQNQGLAMSRNNGIKCAIGEYILPLDADDKINSTYIEKAVKKIDEGFDIVYCEAEYFGTKNEIWKLPEYSLKTILNMNIIFCSALYKKSDWEKVGGYKAAMKHGLEDWEFWLSLIELNAKVYKIPEILFSYRQKEQNSMIKELSKQQEKVKQMKLNIVKFHLDLYLQHKKSLNNQQKLLLLEAQGLNIPFFYKEKTNTHKIYHIGSWTFKIKRKGKMK